MIKYRSFVFRKTNNSIPKKSLSIYENLAVTNSKGVVFSLFALFPIFFRGAGGGRGRNFMSGRSHGPTDLTGFLGQS